MNYNGFSNNFLDKTPKAQITKVKIDKLDCIKNKNCASKDTINRVKRQHMGWEKMCANHI